MADERWRGWLPSEVINPANSPIYHYTDAGGLLGAVTGRQLWATEATGLNDLAEVTQGWKFIRDWAKEQDPNDEIIQKVVEEAGTDEEGDDDVPTRSRLGVFMCCASLRADDANQWRLYGGGGHGYALELNPQIPLAVLADGEGPKRPSRGSSGIWVAFDYAPVTPWLNVLYSDDDKARALEGITAAASEEFARPTGAAERGPQIAQEGLDLFGTRLAWELGRVAQLMKSDGFSGEHEVRVVATDENGLFAKFRATPHGVVRYTQLGTDPSGTSSLVIFKGDLAAGEQTAIPLRSVTLGPLIHAQNNRSTVRALLHSTGFPSCKVYESKVPLGH